MPCELPVHFGLRGQGQAMGDVSPGQQTVILRALGQGYRILRESQRLVRGRKRSGEVVELLLASGHLNIGAQNTGPSHQRLVTLLLAEGEGCFGFFRGGFDFSAFKLQVAEVDEHRASPALMLMPCVNLTGCAQQFHRLGCDVQLARVDGRGSLLVVGRLQIKCDQTLDVCRIDERASQIRVVGIIVSVNSNRLLKETQCSLIVASASNEAPTCRCNVGE